MSEGLNAQAIRDAILKLVPKVEGEEQQQILNGLAALSDDVLRMLAASLGPHTRPPRIRNMQPCSNCKDKGVKV